MSPRIENAINIFLDALNNGTLRKGDCGACAIGNLVRVGMNYTENTPQEWSKLFATGRGVQFGLMNTGRENAKRECPIGFEEIKSTGFTIEESMVIEYTFETTCKIHNFDYCAYNKEAIRADQIRGLEAVVRVMLEFDEQSDDVETIFTNKANLICV